MALEDQELVDVRELLYQQSEQLSNVAVLLQALIQGVGSIDFRPTLALPEIKPEVVIREQDPQILVEAVERSFSKPLSVLADMVAGMRGNIDSLAEKITQGPPTILRGGGAGLTRQDLDASGLAKDTTLTDGSTHVVVDSMPTVAVTVGEVEVKNDSGNPVPVEGAITEPLTLDGDVRVGQNGVVDPFYTIPPPGISLPVGADVLVGPWVSAKDYAGLIVSTKSSGLIEGHVDWSNDGGATTPTVNHTVDSGVFTGAASFTLPVEGTHFRVRVDNIDAAPVNFQVTVIKKYMAVQPFMFPVGGVIDRSWNAVLNKSQIVGEQPDGGFENQRVAGSVPSNTTTANLGVGATFTGAAFDATGFVSILVVVNADKPSATNGLKIQFSDDGFSSVLKEYRFTYSSADTGKGRHYSVPASLGEEFRVVYTNGTTATTTLEVRTELSTTIIQPMTDDIGRGTLLFSPALRISQVLGRTPFHYPVSFVNGDTLLHTTSTGRVAYITDLELTVVNTSLITGAQVVIRDGTTAAGTAKIPLLTEPATNQGNASAFHDHALNDPIAMSSGIFLDIVMGTTVVAGFIHGYEEDV